MNKLFDFIGKNLDKVCHVVVSMLLVIIFAAIFLHTTAGITTPSAAACGLFASVFVGVLKEAIDFLLGTSFSIADLLADVAGSSFGFLLALLLF